MLYLSFLVLALVLSSALTSMTEAALFSAPLSGIYLARDNGRLGARRLLQIKLRMQRPVAALVILNNCINIFGSIFVGQAAQEYFGSAWVGVFSGVLTFLVIIFSEIIPKTLGERFSLGVALAAAPIVLAVTNVLFPLIWLIEHLTRPFAARVPTDVTSEEEIRILADVGKEAGLITVDEKELISSAFRLNDTTARQMMTHRLEIATLEADERLDELDLERKNWSYSRLLAVEDGDLDKIRGIVYQRDVLLALASGKAKGRVGDLAKPVVYVHEGTHAQQLLRRFQRTRQHLFVVLDEYGGTSGIVTLEDVLEQLVGDILDETDEEREAEPGQTASSESATAEKRPTTKLPEKEPPEKLPESDEADRAPARTVGKVP